jgi:ribosomal protein L11 methylase PrmA
VSYGRVALMRIVGQMLGIGDIVRALVIRPGSVWRVPVGLARGVRLEVDPKASLHTYIGTNEFELAQHIRRLARAGYRCFDIGGNEGYYTLALARLTGAEVVSFEFDERVVTRLRRNLALNPRLAGAVRVVKTYVAHEVVVSPPADTLDHLVMTKAVFEPDLIKIDVEGAEAMVLSGAHQLLRTRHPHIVVETHSVSLESMCLRLLREAGYSPEVVDQRPWLRERRGVEQNRWLIAEGDQP